MADNGLQPEVEEVGKAESHPKLLTNNPGEEIEIDEDEQAILRFCMEEDDFDDIMKRGVTAKRVPIEEPELEVGDTWQSWDYSLKTMNKGVTGRTIWITDRAFAQKLMGHKAFGSCDHDVIKITCPCPETCKLLVCSKCHVSFCSNKCIKYARDNTKKTHDLKSLQVIKKFGSTPRAGNEKSPSTSYGTKDKPEFRQQINKHKVSREAAGTPLRNQEKKSKLPGQNNFPQVAFNNIHGNTRKVNKTSHSQQKNQDNGENDNGLLLLPQRERPPKKRNQHSPEDRRFPSISPYLCYGLPAPLVPGMMVSTEYAGLYTYGINGMSLPNYLNQQQTGSYTLHPPIMPACPLKPTRPPGQSGLRQGPRPNITCQVPLRVRQNAVVSQRQPSSLNQPNIVVPISYPATDAAIHLRKNRTVLCAIPDEQNYASDSFS